MREIDGDTEVEKEKEKQFHYNCVILHYRMSASVTSSISLIKATSIFAPSS